MLRASVFSASLAGLAVVVALTGCRDRAGSNRSPADRPQRGLPGVQDAQQQTDDAPGGQAAGAVESCLAELSAEDRAAARRQGVCPVSGQPLGSMGRPYKVRLQGRDVFLCCQGCEGPLRQEPDKYLARLGK